MSEPTPRFSQESGAWISDSSEPDGAPSASPRSTPTPPPSSPSDGPVSRTSATSLAGGSDSQSQRVYSMDAPSPALQTPSGGHHIPAVLTGNPPPSGPVDFHARISPSQGNVGEWSKEPAAASPSPSSGLWNDTDLVGSSWRTFPASSAPTADEISPAFSGGYPNSGMAWRTESSMLAISAWPSDEGEYSSWPRVTLADVLEPSAPPRFFLSPRAAAGILRRAAKRGRELPAALMEALTFLASTTPAQPSATGSPELRREPSADATTSPATTSSSEPSTTSDTTDGLPTPNPSPKDASSSVRRLTPVETERLMGWPDGWTIVEGWSTRSTSGAAAQTTTKRRRDTSCLDPKIKKMDWPI